MAQLICSTMPIIRMQYIPALSSPSSTMEPGKQAIKAVVKSSYVRKGVFPFHLLPAEIQVNVFRRLRDSPWVRSPDAARVGSSTIYALQDPQLHARRSKTCLLLACRAIYTKLAPIHWQVVTVVFKDPIRLANEFLAAASSMAYSNLRHLLYMIDADEKHFQGPGTEFVGLHTYEYNLIRTNNKKLEEVFSVYHELSCLESFQIRLYPGRAFNKKMRKEIREAHEDAERCWDLADVYFRADFFSSWWALKQQLPKKTLEGFGLETRMVKKRTEWIIERPQQRCVKRLNMEFSKTSHGSPAA